MVPFGDLKRQHTQLRTELTSAAVRVIASGWYVLGSEGEAFEREFADACGVGHAVGCANGTDALTLALLALDLEPDAEVIIPAMTAMPTATAVVQAGAHPILADVELDTGLISLESIRRVSSERTKVLLPVHLYGQSCDMKPLLALAAEHDWTVIEDAAQAHGAKDHGKPVGHDAKAACFSFYPSKNLGALGDGGALVTNDQRFAERCRRARNYGQYERYDHREYGINSRLDEIQAAILRVKLPHLATWNERRQQIAKHYDAALASGPVRGLRNRQGDGHVQHLYCVVSERRDDLSAILRDEGISTSIHYPRALGEQPGLKHARGEWANASLLGKSLLTLPMFPELTDDEVESTAHALRLAAERLS